MRGLTLDLHGKPDDLVAFELSSLMLFPNPSDNTSYRMWMLRQLLALAADRHSKHLEAELSTYDKITLSRRIGKDLGEAIHPFGGWGALANATIGLGMKNPLQVDTSEKVRIGKIVGLVLCYALDTGRGIRGAANVICDEVTSDRMDKLLNEKGKKPIRQKPQSFVKNIWPSWKSVAHLWGAYVQKCPMEVESPRRWLSLDQCRNGVDGFIKHSEYLLDTASKHFPPRGPRKPILSHETCWKILL